jgi:hypothetical protein
VTDDAKGPGTEATHSHEPALVRFTSFSAIRATDQASSPRYGSNTPPSTLDSKVKIVSRLQLC